ncbi:MAG: hypothetical protein CVU56_27280 [Deltaproteobacteria bacterium HGW-Deltaproteobacteria-14]|jgi:hypothetical protein|nr:MAG: hypothetical protein CVU56_27280 [Deltaproteobacteria bacterium HGW-Deltaproteobacteria-14]
MTYLRARFAPLATAALLSLAACAAGPAMTSGPGVGPEPASDPVGDLERAQLQEVAAYDGATAGDDRCERLCAHLDAICNIGGRICELAAAHPSDPAAAACERAQERCASATSRLPPECVICAGP